MAFKCKHCGNEFPTLPALGGHVKNNCPANPKRKVQAQNAPAAPSSMAQDAQGSNIPSNVPAPAARRLQAQPNTAAPSPQVLVPGQSGYAAPAPVRIEGDVSWINQQLSTPITEQELARMSGAADDRMAKMQAYAAQQARMMRTPPPPPDGMEGFRQEGMVDRIGNSIDWNVLAQEGFKLLGNIVSERRERNRGPSLAEQVGMLAIQNFAGSFAKSRGTTAGKRELGMEEQDEAANPVMQVMFKEMQERMDKEKSEREEMAKRWDAVESELSNARQRLANTSAATAPQPMQPPAAQPQEQPIERPNSVLELHEAPSAEA